MEAHERLRVWAKVTEVGTRIYRATGPAVQRRCPELVDDLRAAIVAARVAIAMGVAARDDVVFAERLDTARLASRRAEAYANIAHGVGAIQAKDYAVIEARLSELQAMLVGLRRRVLTRCEVRERARRGGTRRDP